MSPFLSLSPFLSQNGGFSTTSNGSFTNLNMLNPSQLWTILSFASNVYSTAAGATAGLGGPFNTAGQVNLETQLPVGGQFLATPGSFDSHSDQFIKDNAFVQYYWNLVMKRFGLLNTSEWHDLTGL